MTGGIWSLTQTLNGFSTNSRFGWSLSYNPIGTQFAVGAFNTNSGTGMYEMYVMYDSCGLCRIFVTSIESRLVFNRFYYIGFLYRYCVSIFT